MNNSVKIPAAILLISAIILLAGCRGKGIPAGAQKTLDQYIAYWNTG
jgi:hypothetical protein